MDKWFILVLRSKSQHFCSLTKCARLWPGITALMITRFYYRVINNRWYIGIISISGQIKNNFLLTMLVTLSIDQTIVIKYHDRLHSSQGFASKIIVTIKSCWILSINASFDSNRSTYLDFKNATIVQSRKQGSVTSRQ